MRVVGVLRSSSPSSSASSTSSSSPASPRGEEARHPRGDSSAPGVMSHGSAHDPRDSMTLRKLRVRSARSHRGVMELAVADPGDQSRREVGGPAEPPSPSPPSPTPHRTPERHSCARCGAPIRDKIILKVGSECWHGRCLECSVCQAPLGGLDSCYIRDKAAYCKPDYYRRFGAACARCERRLEASDWVRRARGRLYHLACFACGACGRQLATGEEFGVLRERLLCRSHYQAALERLAGGAVHVGGSLSEGGPPSDGEAPPSKPAKRARTSFTAEQLQVMQAQFAQDNNPDAQTLQKLADMTGLSRRVIQVWFQNCRARHKKHISPGLGMPPGHLALSAPEDSAYTPYLSAEGTILATYLQGDAHYRSSPSSPSSSSIHCWMKAAFPATFCGRLSRTREAAIHPAPPAHGTRFIAPSPRWAFARARSVCTYARTLNIPPHRTSTATLQAQTHLFITSPHHAPHH
ncbi:unnamed protein product [Lampetra fluviatilis]